MPSDVCGITYARTALWGSSSSGKNLWDLTSWISYVWRRISIIELDGGQHVEQLPYDQQRDAWLSNQGYTVLRFWNNEVMQGLEAVLEKIRMVALSPSPSPTSGRGEENRSSRHTLTPASGREKKNR